MALVSKNIPNLINGVSQQPAALRLESQGEVQENGFSDVVDGLKKRPPTKFIKKLVKTNHGWHVSSADKHLYGADENDFVYTQPLTESELSTAFFHTYKRSDNEQYQVVITTDTIVRVYDIHANLRYESDTASWDATGTFIAFTDDGSGLQHDEGDDTSYLPTDTSKIKATSVADATFFVNTTQPVQMVEEFEHPKTNDEALVYLKSVNYGRGYRVNVKQQNGDITTGLFDTDKQITETVTDGDEVNNDALKVSNVIEDLREDLYTGVAFQTIVDEAGRLDGDRMESSPVGRTHYDTGDERNMWYSYRVINVPAADPNEADNFIGTNENLIKVKVGNNLYDYDPNGSNNDHNTTGWYWHNATKTKIRLPRTAVQVRAVPSGTRGRYTHYWFYRPYTELSRIGNSGVSGLVVTPTAYSDEPYFVLSSLNNFDISVSDDDGGVNFKAFKGTAKSFTDLPNQCEEGIRLGVVGDNQKKEDDFHVVFTGKGGQGYWKETTGYDQYNSFDMTTMPHVLRQLPNGAFVFTQGCDQDGNQWASRKAGDDNTNTYPSFVGYPIQDIFFHRNRLGVLSGENVIFSEAGGYLNFWRTTVRTLLDSDPIDVSVSQNEVADLKAAIPIQDNLLLFSELNQFTLSAAQLLTPTEVSIDQSTKYECDLTATPVGAGTSVFFATKSGNFSGVREFFTKDDTEAKDAPEITTHVPKYIKGRVRDLKASSNEDILIALTDDDKTECYVYKWYNSSQERLQSSWSKWKFSKNIASIYFNNADLYFTFEDGSYELMDLAQLTNPVFLDHQVEITTFGEGYAPPDGTAISAEGYDLGAYSDSNETVTNYLDGTKSITVGVPYTFKYQMSEQVFKPVQGDSTKLARFQLRKMSFNFSNTGKFDVTVDSLGRDPSVKTFTGRILGTPDNILGQAAVVPEGSFAVGVQSKPATTKITITNDTHLPSVFQSAEWEAFVVLRNQRL